MHSPVDKLQAAAWLLDGEGTITIRPKTRTVEKTKVLYSPRIRAVNLDRDILYELRIYLGAGNIGLEKARGNRRAIWYWELGAKQDCLRILEAIEPFLHRKRAIACRVIEYLRCGEALSPEQQGAFYDAVSALQSKNSKNAANATGPCKLHHDFRRNRSKKRKK